MISGYLNRGSAWLLEKLGNVVRDWLISIRGHTVPLYHEYVEGMFSDYTERRQRWRNENKSEFEILFLSIPWGVSILLGICRLNVDRLRRGISLLIFATEQILALTHSLTPLSIYGQFIKRLLGWLHRLTGNVGIQTEKIELRLSPTAQVTAWSAGAEMVLGFSCDEVIGQEATDSFIPEVESGGRSLTTLIKAICTSPEQHSLNINENQHRNGARYWVLWVNVPVYCSTKELVEVICVGVKIEDSNLMKHLVNGWRCWQRLFTIQ